MEFTQGVRFDSLGLLPEMTRALEKKNIEWSTPVQAGCIPPMRAWKDVIAKAPTGTGKTFAFGIPIIEHIDPESEEVQAVIMAPTRELAMQITAELRDLAIFMSGIRVVCLYGGAPIGKQIDALKKKPQIVVATPGRLSDHMKRRTVRLDRVQTVVLDEADRMLDMGFIHDVTRILDKIPSRRNLGMFSATISREVMDISWVYQRDPEEITVRADEQNKPDILQYAVTVEQTDKVAAASCLCSSPPTSPPAASTWTTWTRCSTTTCRRRTNITSTASDARAARSVTASLTRSWRTTRARCGSTPSPSSPETTSSPPTSRVIRWSWTPNNNNL